MANGNEKVNLKLSEAVEMVSRDILPDARPEDFEITTVAAVSEPFADAVVRNKAARERFKKMVDTKTKQAKKDLGLDDQLKERQANGNGKLVEDIKNAHEAREAIKDAFDESYWATYSYIREDLANKLEEGGVYNEPAFYYLPTIIDSRLRALYMDIKDAYIRDYTKMHESAEKPLGKLSLDEGLFEDFEEEHVGKSSKKDFVSREKPLAKTPVKEAVTMNVRGYKPWSGAIETYDTLENENKLDYFFDLLEDVYPNGIDVNTLNDLLWFDRDWVYDLVGIENPNDANEEGDEE